MNIDQLRPMLATEKAVAPFTDPAWHFEIKFDGHRMLAATGPDAAMRTRNGADSTKWYPEVAEALKRLPAGCIIDGEACVLDDIGRSVFDRMQDRSTRRRWDAANPVTLEAFDLLYHRGKPVMHLPLVKRRALLAKLVPGSGILYVADLPAEADLFRQFVLGLQLEGFVAKRRDSLYAPGERSDAWLKIKRAGAVPPQRFKR